MFEFLSFELIVHDSAGGGGFRVVTWIITVIIGAVPVLCPRCAKTPPKSCSGPQESKRIGRPWGALWVTVGRVFCSEWKTKVNDYVRHFQPAINDEYEQERAQVHCVGGQRAKFCSTTQRLRGGGGGGLTRVTARGGLTPPPLGPGFIVGKNEFVQKEMSIWAVFGAQNFGRLGCRPPPPPPPPPPHPL